MALPLWGPSQLSGLQPTVDLLSTPHLPPGLLLPSPLKRNLGTPLPHISLKGSCLLPQASRGLQPCSDTFELCEPG